MWGVSLSLPAPKARPVAVSALSSFAVAARAAVLPKSAGWNSKSFRSKTVCQSQLAGWENKRAGAGRAAGCQVLVAFYASCARPRSPTVGSLVGWI